MKGKNILLVDDEADIRETLEIFLEDAGFAVTCADNGEAGLARFREQRPEVTIADIKMPSMDGIELLERIKRIDPEAEVIMITGHGDMDLAVKSLKHEACDFITKPIRVEALEIAIKRACDRIAVREKLADYTRNLEALLQEKLTLQDHLSQLGMMIGSVSHSIKGLLTGLDGGMFMLEQALEDKDEARVAENMEIVKGVVSRIKKMVLDILLYAKERHLEWETVNVADFAREVARVIQAKLARQKIRFATEVDPAAGEVEIDPGLVHSALVNILDNAVDACEKDAEKREHHISFRVRQDRKSIVFEVYDNGIGMDAETLDKIFTLFFSTKGKKGTGLGLFISHKIIEQHGGSISVDSARGRGSRFCIRLPKTQPEGAEASGADA